MQDLEMMPKLDTPKDTETTIPQERPLDEICRELINTYPQVVDGKIMYFVTGSLATS